MLQRLPVRRAFTLLELLVVLAILVVLAAILWPAFVRTHHGPPYRAMCGSNLKQVSTALLMYVQDYDERLPPFATGPMGQPTTVPALLYPYVKNGRVWQCRKNIQERKRPPFHGEPGVPAVDYGYNWLALSPSGGGLPLKDVRDPVYTAVFVETASYLAVPTDLAGGNGASAPTDRHGDVINTAWLDGHVKGMKRSVLEETPAEENGTPLGVGIDAYRYWNLK